MSGFDVKDFEKAITGSDKQQQDLLLDQWQKLPAEQKNLAVTQMNKDGFTAVLDPEKQQLIIEPPNFHMAPKVFEPNKAGQWREGSPLEEWNARSNQALGEQGSQNRAEQLGQAYKKAKPAIDEQVDKAGKEALMQAEKAREELTRLEEAAKKLMGKKDS